MAQKLHVIEAAAKKNKNHEPYFFPWNDHRVFLNTESPPIAIGTQIRSAAIPSFFLNFCRNVPGARQFAHLSNHSVLFVHRVNPTASGKNQKENRYIQT